METYDEIENMEAEEVLRTNKAYDEEALDKELEVLQHLEDGQKKIDNSRERKKAGR